MSLRGLCKKTRTPSETDSSTSLIITGFTAATNRLTYLVESAMLIPTLIRLSMRINQIRCSCAAVINLRHHEHSTLQCRCGLAAGTADRLMSGDLVVCSLFCNCLVVPLFMWQALFSYSALGRIYCDQRGCLFVCSSVGTRAYLLTKLLCCLATAVARSSGVAICCILPVLWMTS